MKKLLAICCIASLLCSCAAEKRLARFLQRHPELQRIDTVVFHDTITLPADSNALVLTLSDLVAMDSIASAAKTEDTDSVASNTTSASVSTDRSKAALQALGNGNFKLSTTAPPDTIYLEKEVPVPHLVTEYKDKEVPVYKLKWWQQPLIWTGAFALLYIIIRLVLQIIAKYVKPI